MSTRIVAGCTNTCAICQEHRPVPRHNGLFCGALVRQLHICCLLKLLFWWFRYQTKLRKLTWKWNLKPPGLEDDLSLFKLVIFRFQPLVCRGVYQTFFGGKWFLNSPTSTLRIMGSEKTGALEIQKMRAKNTGHSPLSNDSYGCQKCFNLIRLCFNP